MATALTRPSINLMLAPERRRTIDFKRDIEPVLKLKCETAACHAGKGVRFSAANVTPGRARTSPLVWAISGRNTSRLWDAAPRDAAQAKLPPTHSAILTPSEKRAIIEWIDLGAGGRR